jgi:predicted DNA-binding transcriptional regulator AlpA
METFVLFAQLREQGINYTRVHLNRLMDRGLFPPAIRLSPNRIVWRQADIDRFKASRPTSCESAPVLWPVRKPKKGRGQTASCSEPVGRKPGSRVVGGKVVMPEEAGDAAD